MALAARLAYNTIIQIIGKIIATILGLAAVAVMARYLNAAGFGQYTIIMTFLSFFAIMADFGLTLVTAQMVSRPRADEEKLLNNLFSLRLVSAVVFLALAPLIVIFFPYQPIVKLGVAVASLSFFFTALNQILVGWFQKNLTMTAVSAAEVLSRLALLGGIIITAAYNFGLIGVIAATVAASLINFLIHFWFARRLIQLSWQIDPAVWREIISLAWPMGITIFFNLIYLRADSLILSLLKSQTDVGLYGAAYKIIDVLTALPFMFAGLILPILTAAWSQNDGARFKNILQKSLDVMFMAALPLLVGAQIVSTRLITVVAGRDFSAAGPILQILILAISFIFVGCLLAHAVIALNKQRQVIAAYIFTATTSLAGYLIFIPLYSYYGAAWVTVYSEAAIALFSLYAVRRYGDFHLNLKMFFRAAAAAAAMALIIYLLKNRLDLAWLITLGGFIYLSGLYAFGAINRRDLKNLLTDS